MRFQVIVKTLQGLEGVLAKELAALGAGDLTMLKRAVSCYGDTELLYAANIYLRTALRVLKPVYSFTARNESILYQKVKEFNWTGLFDADCTFAIDTTVYSGLYTNTQYPALKMKDAIADQFREKFGVRPSVDREHPDIMFNLHMQDDHVTISLDSSGESLHKRGYRTLNHEAPISEVLAAGLLFLSGWDKKQPLYDPMCGSGTIPIEAALLANNIAPGLIRKDFAFKRWKDFDQNLYRQILLRAASETNNSATQITGSDISAQSIEVARQNSVAAKVEDRIRFFVNDFSTAEPPPDKGIIIINPPYGERLKPEDINLLYQSIGTTLKRKYAGYTVWIVTSNLEAVKHIGLKPSTKLKLKNGPIDCMFYRYEMMEGRYFKASVG